MSTDPFFKPIVALYAFNILSIPPVRILVQHLATMEEEYIKMYFHYEPSTYHLHIHFVNISSNQLHSSVEYSHELNNVMFNVKMMSDYYKIVLLNVRV